MKVLTVPWRCSGRGAWGSVSRGSRLSESGNNGGAPDTVTVDLAGRAQIGGGQESSSGTDAPVGATDLGGPREHPCDLFSLTE